MRKMDYFGTFLDTMNQHQAAKDARSLELRAAALQAENDCLRQENTTLKEENQRLHHILELALQAKGIGQKVSTVA